MSTVSDRESMPVGRAALIASVGGQRGWADWANPAHRARRLLAEFIGMAGLTFILSGGAAVLARYGGHALQPWETVLVLSLVSALWLVVAVYFLGDISAHFNPATTLAFALRRDMGWVMAGVYWVVQFAAAVCGSLLARAFFGPAGHLAATMPQPGQSWQAAAFEMIITFGLILMILNMANGPKLNGPFVPLAVGAYILAWGTMGRAGGRRGHRGWRRARAARPGQGAGGRRVRGNATGPRRMTKPGRRSVPFVMYSLGFREPLETHPQVSLRLVQPSAGPTNGVTRTWAYTPPGQSLREPACAAVPCSRRCSPSRAGSPSTAERPARPHSRPSTRSRRR